MTEAFKKAQKTRPAVVCRPAPKPNVPERRRSLRQGDQLVVAGSHSSFVLEVSSSDTQGSEEGRG